MSDTKFNIRQDTQNDTTFDPKKVLSSSTDYQVRVCPSAANFPETSPSQFLIYLPEEVDQRDLTARPCKLYKGSLGGTLLNRLSSDPTGQTDSYQLAATTTEHRGAVLLSSNLAGETIYFDYWGLGSIVDADYFNGIDDELLELGDTSKYIHIKKDSNQTVDSATDVKLTWESAVSDPDSEFDNVNDRWVASNSYTIDIDVMLRVVADITTSTDGNPLVFTIYKNGVAESPIYYNQLSQSSSGVQQSLRTHTPVYHYKMSVVKDDYIEFFVNNINLTVSVQNIFLTDSAFFIRKTRGV